VRKPPQSSAACLECLMTRMLNDMSEELRRLIAGRAECYPPFLSALSET
jgi:hypothetical protein